MANTALTLQSSNEELKAYFEAVCRIVDSNRDEFPINLDEVWIENGHLYVSFIGTSRIINEYDVLSTISATPIKNIVDIYKIKKAVDKIVPQSNRTYHNLSFVIDSHLMGCRLAGTSYYGKVRERPKYTYLMRDSNTGMTKIGSAVDCIRREGTLQSEKPSISLLATCNGADIERELHRKYRDKRIRGEWFNLSDKEVAKIMKEYGFRKSCKNE